MDSPEGIRVKSTPFLFLAIYRERTGLNRTYSIFLQESFRTVNNFLFVICGKKLPAQAFIYNITNDAFPFQVK
jgi:hypothetical protein